MTAHLTGDILVGLALDDLEPAARAEALAHLRDCGACRAGYDETGLAIDAVLPATPALEPSPGFDERVLTAMGMSPTTAAPHDASPAPAVAVTSGDDVPAQATPPAARGGARHRRGRWRLLPAAAALAVGLALGAGGAWLAAHDDSQVTTIGTPMTDAAGAVVGSVIEATDAGRPVLVVAISDGPDGARYTCWVTLTDESRVDVGTWVLADGEGTWVLTDVDPERAVVVEMVREDGTVWSSADLA